MGSIDWGYPNDEAIQAMHAYSTHDSDKGYPDGTTQAAYDSWMAYYNKHSSNNPNHSGVDFDNWKDEVRAEHPEWVEARDWYSTNIVGDGWKNLVKEYKENITDPSNVKPPGFNDQSDWIDENATPTGSGFKPPTVGTFTGDAASTNGVAVNTAALEWFAKEVLQKLTGNGNILLSTMEQLKTIDPKPGAFARAEVLRQAIVGATGQDGGVRGDMADMLYNMNNALIAVADALLKMAGEYKNLEELNSMTTEKLTEIMGDSFKGLDGLSTYGQKTVKTDGN
ncbi:hypothetical protein [Actinoplanes sp. NBRC 101535]|uniref:hypothetical protein n=1 Tax=Actinoplanes sp. NBRC 101535 TaxID=3032196 RepID=UPI0024A51479|nr:hypothetical protein [Actinoplanes sp. NBRC 101535]GLY00701.1 hypothetical protein Acsp01_10800 [Actinoplanes sp. NBRC 101535]